MSESEESEFSSLERKDRDMYSKVNRKPTPHKKKHRHHRNQEKYMTQVYHDPRHTDHERLQGIEHGEKGLFSHFILFSPICKKCYHIYLSVRQGLSLPKLLCLFKTVLCWDFLFQKNLQSVSFRCF